MAVVEDVLEVVGDDTGTRVVLSRKHFVSQSKDYCGIHNKYLMLLLTVATSGLS